jgi:hypothetical protein
MSSFQVGRSQDQPMGQWVEDAGKSEGHAVMAWIGIQAIQQIAVYPTRKRANFQQVFHR